MSNELVTAQVNDLAGKLSIPESNDLVAVLKATAFKGQVSDAQMSALLIVANQYRLNPWTKEIYAYPDKNNGITPVVGVDGWARIINENPHFDGMDFDVTDDSVTCTIYRKDRQHPIRVTEYLSECKKNTPPWESHPKRMLRHKAMIQCARLAFGYGGIYDQDEAETIRERKEIDITPKEKTDEKPLENYPEERFQKNFPSWEKVIKEGKKTAADVIAMVSSKAVLTPEQERAIIALDKNIVEGE